MFPYEILCNFVKKYHTENDKYSLEEKIQYLEKAIKDGGYYGKDGVWNSIMTFSNDNHIYRGRVETLIIKDNKYVYLKTIPAHIVSKRTKRLYAIPGGSFERDLPNIDQAVNECKEEALINVKNIRSSGITYKDYQEPSEKMIISSPVNWDGRYTEIYVAEFDSWYHGHIDEVDKDSFIASGRFYPIEDVYSMLQKEHKEALKNMMSDIVKITESTNVTTRQKILDTTVNILKDNNIRFSIMSTDKRKFINGESSGFGQNALCISGFKESDMKRIASMVNKVIRPMNATLKPDNYGTMFLVLRKEKFMNEDALTSEERKFIPSRKFGVPSLRKYPLHDKDHVKAAIRFFNKIDSKHEKELAYNIIKRMKYFGMSQDMIGQNNRLYNYLYYFD